MHRMVPLVVLAAVLAVPVGASAQARQPAEGAIAVGGAIGAFLPAEDALGNSLYLEGQFQFQFSPRIGVRFGVGWTDSDFDREDEDSLEQIRIGADLLYNWEHGAWHPYVGAGLGAHLVQEKDNGRELGDGESELGGSLLGGVEYFLNRDTVISGEVRYQVVQEVRGLSPSGVLLAAGLKKYF